MTDIDVLSHRSLPNHLVVAKEFGKSKRDADRILFEAPTRALPSDLLEGDEQFFDELEGIHEIHIRISTTDFSDSTGDIDPTLAREFSEQVEKVPEDEIAVALIEYTGNTLFSLDAARNIAEELQEHYDVLISPLMSEQVDDPYLDINRENYDRFVENSETFLEATDHLDVSVLGALPVVSWSLVDEDEGLLDVLLKHEVDGFCVDYLDKKPTARNRVNRWLSPFIERLGREGKHRDTVLYAVNAYRGRNLSDAPGSPAEDFYVFGLGFDILGRRFYTSQTGWPDDDTIRLRCFDVESFEQRYIDIGELEAHLPLDTGFGHGHIMDLVEDRENRIRLQELLEAEQMAIAYGNLRQAIHGDLGPEFIRERVGTLERIENTMKAAKEAYDEGSSNPSISTY